jgi:heparinase II/III-like protein
LTSSSRSRAARILRKPPHVVARKAAQAGRAELERLAAPRRARRLTERALLAKLEAADLASLWERLAAAPYVSAGPALTGSDLDEVAPGERARILGAADDVVDRRVDLLGSGPIELGTPVDWLCDFKTGRRWEPAYARRIEYTNLDEPSDVKVPWELSRMQWLIPAGQAYALTGDERYAFATRALLEEWIAANPYAYTVNWSCTMDVALRAMTWTYLFHTLHASEAWADTVFRGRFLRSLYLHGDFTERNLEWSDINGNHYTADAAGLVFVGLFFARGAAPEQWHDHGWRILLGELPRQVTDDGVDFEASSAYHRLVTELFFLPALYRLRRGYDVPESYRARLAGMAMFASAYAREDGTTPLWGDADDARALPMGGQDLNDHRYLAGAIGLALSDDRILDRAAGPRSEAVWLHGAGLAASLSDRPTPPGLHSESFPQAGVYLMRGEHDHVFVDCGPVGLAGRGGHGHNDCLAFDAVLAGVHLVADPGSYVYTASPEWRNRFRSTAAHNTPVIDGAEQNRFTGPLDLWTLRDDATPCVLLWRPERALFRGTHSGYGRLPGSVAPVRTLALDGAVHRLAVQDQFEGAGEHTVTIRYTFAPAVELHMTMGAARLEALGEEFVLAWDGEWSVEESDAWFSPSYGVKQACRALEFSRAGPLRPLLVVIAPATAAGDALEWGRSAVEES